MTTISEAPRPSGIANDSLSDLLRRLAYAQLPGRFHTLVQLGLPLAYQLWSWGWPRTAGWLTALALFSLWALAEQRLTGRADSEVIPVSSDPKRGKAWRLVRRVTATGSSILALSLLLEAFAQLMATVFKCPGCAG
ncbi:MAG TPA: hypothetical protein VIP11_03280 [Gemmatimonadaceae bacterium]